jgi:hypothetical protein
MSENKSSQPRIYPLDILNRLLETPELLPHENGKEFVQLFESLQEYGKPQTTRDYIAVYQATVLTWDNLRYQKMKIGVLRSHQRPALESLLRKIQVQTAPKKSLGEAFAQSEARKLAAPWFKDPASRSTTMNVIKNAGYPPDALEVEAFQLALPALATIERLIVSAQKRLNVFLDDLERTSKAAARALRLATEKAIAANDAGVGVKKAS